MMKNNIRYINDKNNFIPFTLETAKSNNFPTDIAQKIIDLFEPLYKNGNFLAYRPYDSIYCSKKDYYTNVIKNLHIVNNLEDKFNCLDLKIELHYRYDFTVIFILDECFINKRNDIKMSYNKIRKDIMKKYIGLFIYDRIFNFNKENVRKIVSYINNNLKNTINNNYLEDKQSIVQEKLWSITTDDVRILIDELNQFFEENKCNAKAHLIKESKRPYYDIVINNNLDDKDITYNEKYSNYTNMPPHLTEWYLGHSNSIFQFSLFYKSDKWIIDITDVPYCSNDFINKNIGWLRDPTTYNTINECCEMILSNFKKSKEIYNKIRSLGY